MKIKTVKKMNLPELIKYVWDEQIRSTYGATQYHSNLNTVVEVDMSGQVSVHGRHYGNEVYTVPVTEELTEETEFDELWEVYYNKGRDDVDTYTNGKVNGFYSTTISQILQENSIDRTNVTLAIYHRDTLIWTKESGIPESGVLEVE